MSLEGALIGRIKDDVIALVESGTEVVLAFSQAARTIVGEAATIGEDLATTALATVRGAIGAAGEISATTIGAVSDVAVSAEDAAGAAATGAVEAAADVSTAAGARVRDAVSGTIDGVKVVVSKAIG